MLPQNLNAILNLYPDAEEEVLLETLFALVSAELERVRAEDEKRRQARLTGLTCSCCDKPLPDEWEGDECAECAQYE